MARIVLLLLNAVLLSSVFSRVIPTKHDLVVVENQDKSNKSNSGIDMNETDGDDDYDPSVGPFIPTHEWQIVKRGQRVPAGLHIRMNFQTKIREAKLMDGDDGSRYQNLSGEKVGSTEACSANENCNTEDPVDSVGVKGPKIILSPESKSVEEFARGNDKLYFTKSQLKEALKDFRDKLGTTELKEEQTLTGSAQKETVKQNFRSIEDIRAELKDVFAFNTKSDTEIIASYLELLQRPNSTMQEIEVALEDLEYYVHQIDNAQDLAKMNGLRVLVDYLNQSESETFQEKAAKVIAAATQSNPIVQNATLSTGVINVLLRIMSTTPSLILKKRALYALSATLRGFGQAQKVFLKLDGLKHLLSVIRNQKNGNVRMQGLTLVTDLLTEQKEVIRKINLKQKQSKVEKIPLLTALAEHGWCELLPEFLDTRDYDMLEKGLEATIQSRDGCQPIFKHTNLPTLLEKGYNFLEDMYEKESDTDFKEYLGKLKSKAASIDV